MGMYEFVMRADVLTGLRRTPPPLRGTPSGRGTTPPPAGHPLREGEGRGRGRKNNVDE